MIDCPRCKSPLVDTPSYTTDSCEFWKKCSRCNTYVNTYQPMPHQVAVHKDSHTYIGNFGAYGTGKTTTTREEVFKHILITPNANILIGAEETSQYEQTLRRELEADLPEAWVKGVSARYNFIDLINGARIIYRPLKDWDMLRSYNLSMVVILEASNTSGEVFHQLKTRLRNKAAIIPFPNKDAEESYADWRKCIIESNPDSGWIRTDVLLTSSKIYKHGSVKDTYKRLPGDIDDAISTHISTTDVNTYLPKTFIKEQIKNKPPWWVARYIYGSFQYAEGLVYPNAITEISIIPEFEPDPTWPRVLAHDYGLSDDSRFLWGALDKQGGKLYIYKERSANNTSIDDLAQIFHEGCSDIPQGGFLVPPIIDPKSGPKRDYEKRSLIDLYADYGVLFYPGQINLDSRIFRLNTYFEADNIRIMDCCSYLIGELREYKYPGKTLNSGKNKPDKPIDKDNHSINCLEWIVMELPADPTNATRGAMNQYGKNLMRVSKGKAADKLSYAEQLFISETEHKESAPWNMSY